MVQKPWFKVFVWFMATFFFFLASGVVISILKPGPSETEVMKYMMAMMSAMDNSIMGVMMSIEQNMLLKNIIYFSSVMLIPIIGLAVVAGFVLRFMHGGKGDV